MACVDASVPMVAENVASEENTLPQAYLLFHPLALFSLILSCLQIPVSCDQPLIHTSFPGFPGRLPFYLETGYVGVGESNHHQLFYYFVQSETNPKEDPLLLWLTGGPGCSSWSGLVYEIGPLKFEKVEYNGSLPTLCLNPYSWTKLANIIFIDAPVGTGFSYSRDIKDDGMGDFKSCKEMHQFLRVWLNDHPQFLKNPLYIAGDSYSGKTIPVLTQSIALSNRAGQEPFLNLKGYLIGNPLTDLDFDLNAKIPFLHGMGIISNELYESAKENCNGSYISPRNSKCEKDLQEVNKCTFLLNIPHILEPKCVFASPKAEESDDSRRSLEGSPKLLSELPFGAECRTHWYLLSSYWANSKNVRKALGIHKGSKGRWIRCNSSLSYTREVVSAIPYHHNLTKNGYRALIYSGDHDFEATFVGTQAWIRSLNYSIVEDWRSWLVDGQIAGYTRTYANHLTFATMKGAGHTAPEYRPKEGLAMLQRWISGKPL